MFIVRWFASSLIVIYCGAAFADSLPAFPGAEGFGAHAVGGRDGQVLFVTNLKDYVPGEAPIPGSFRAAIDAQGPRTIIFRVSGTIPLEATLAIREPFVTIAGQSAPGGGICTKNYGISVQTHDVIVRYIRSRPGDEIGRQLAKQGKSWATDALSIGSPSENVILDHCSTSWANDEVLSVSGAGIDNVTVQWCIISDSLNESTHEKGAHGYGSLIRTNGRVTFHHNLYAFHRSRSPRPGTYGEGRILFDFRNNVMHHGGKGYSAKDPVRMNFVANYHPNTPFDATETCEYYSAGNEGRIEGGQVRDTPFETAPVTTTDATTARAAVLAHVGASRPARDAEDADVINLVQNDSERDDSYSTRWPVLQSEPPAPDSDQDGMPDEWESAHGLNVGKTNHNGDEDDDGYTNLEEFLNGTNPAE